MLGAGLASSTQGGTITSGSFQASSISVYGKESATVSGENFTATVINTDGGALLLGWYPPFQASVPGFNWSGEQPSGVLYNGFFYSVPPFEGPSPGVPFANDSFTEKMISPGPIVTGPGTYSLDLFSVTLHFSLFDSSHTMFYSETDTGFATGSITYTGNAINTFVSSHSFQATIIPEPSTWSLIALAACCLGAFAVAQHARAVSSTEV
jgi:hypothetical protein